MLRYVYDNTQAPTTQNSRVSCADVLVLPRNDVQVSVRASLAAEQAPLSGSSALRRLLDSAWAKDAARKLDIFQTSAQIAAGENDWSSQQIRMADPPIVAGANSFTMNFVFSDTTAASAQQLANSFNDLGTSGLSVIFGGQTHAQPHTLNRPRDTRICLGNEHTAHACISCVCLCACVQRP